MPKISVIIPLYNGEVFLSQTLVSLCNQQFTDFEAVLVDDCSTDSSAEIVACYTDRDPRFRYIKTPKNFGIVAKVMNFAADFAQGDYFVDSSQDDLFSVDWLEKMYSAAVNTGADAVLPDLEFYYDDESENQQIIGLKGDRSVQLTGREAFIYSLDWTIAGNALWRMDFLKETGFSDFGMFADEYTVRLFFLLCKKVVFCDGMFIYRSDNPNAITRKFSSKLLDATFNNVMLWRLIVENGFGEDIQGPQAVRTIRSIIRAKKMLSKNPSFASCRGVVDACFVDIRSPAFKNSLRAGLNGKAGFFKKATYLHVWTSKRMFDANLFISSKISGLKNIIRSQKAA